MNGEDVCFVPLPGLGPADELELLIARPRHASAAAAVPSAQVGATVVTARLHGFDLQDAPVLADHPRFPGELVTARCAVPLRRSMIDAAVLVLHEEGDWARPIVAGVLQQRVCTDEPAAPAVAPLALDLDGERLTLSAEREITLRCGDASITLTRAGKVIIRGNYVVSRATGHNKIKGAAIEIN